MTGPAGLERGYRRLLAWYPQPFRSEHEEEILAVLMAGAREGQRRPRLVEAGDVIRSALRMRLRPAEPASENRPWADALAVFSVAAPLFVLVAGIVEVAVPYHVPVQTPVPFPFLARVLGRHPEIGGLSLLSQHGFDSAVGCQVIIVALVLLGLRRTALAAIVASAVYWAVARYWIPDPLALLSTSAYLLVTAALIASPGPRRGRRLMNWRHGAALLMAAAAVQVSTLMYEATSPLLRFLARRPPHVAVYFWMTVVLAVAAVSLMVVLRLDRYFLLLLAAMFYPYVMQLAYPAASSNDNLLGHPTPGHLALLYLPPLLLACWAMVTAVVPRRSRMLRPSGPENPG